MNIIVPVKQVPNTAEVRIDPKTGNLIREGVDGIINPEDRHALEAALTCRDSVGGHVTALSMGPPQAMEVICEAVGMGADKGILLSDKAFAGADTWATSTTLGMAIRRIGNYDLIICGRQAIDGDTAQIGPQLAEFLGIPQLTYVQEIELTVNGIIVERALEDGCERIEAPLPALVTVLAALNRPRHPTVRGMICAASDRAPIEVWNAADIGVKVNEVGFAGSLTQVVKTFVPKEGRKTRYLEGSPGAIAGELLQCLKAGGIRFGE